MRDRHGKERECVTECLGRSLYIEIEKTFVLDLDSSITSKKIGYVGVFEYFLILLSLLDGAFRIFLNILLRSSSFALPFHFRWAINLFERYFNFEHNSFFFVEMKLLKFFI